MRLAWLTDLHLNFVNHRTRQALYTSIKEANPEATLVTGDWAEADSLLALLTEWQTELNIPTYFVLGNHDFYHGNFATTRNQLTTLPPNLQYLTTSSVIYLDKSTALIGHDSWADARCGNFFLSPIRLNDHVLIADLCNRPPKLLFKKLNELGDQAASTLEQKLNQALTTHQHVILATHVPPYREACWHQGRISDDDWLPHFASKAVGEKLTPIMQQHPDQTLTIYCGHTHSSGTAHILPNLTVHTGQATYGQPAIQQILE